MGTALRRSWAEVVTAINPQTIRSKNEREHILCLDEVCSLRAKIRDVGVRFTSPEAPHPRSASPRISLSPLRVERDFQSGAGFERTSDEELIPSPREAGRGKFERSERG